MPSQLHIHILLAGLSILLLWSSTLSVCKQVSFYFISKVISMSEDDVRMNEFNILWDIHIISNTVDKFVSLLNVEMSQYETCLNRQTDSCFDSMEVNILKENEKSQIQLNDFRNESKYIETLVSNCEVEMNEICLLMENSTESLKNEQDMNNKMKKTMKIELIQEQMKANRLLSDTFWNFVDCVQPNGRKCETLSLSDTFSEMISLFVQVHQYDLEQIQYYNEKIQGRISRADSFIQSVRSITNNLEAVGIHLGIPPTELPFQPFQLGSLPNIGSVSQIYDRITKSSVDRIRSAQMTVESQSSELINVLEQELNETTINTLIQEISQRHRFSDFLSYQSIATELPSTLSIKNHSNSSLYLQKLESLEKFLSNLDYLTLLAIQLDLSYRVFKSIYILINAFRSTSKIKASRQIYYDDDSSNVSSSHRPLYYYFFKFCQKNMSYLLTSLITFLLLVLFFQSYQGIFQDYYIGCEISKKGNSLSENFGILIQEYIFSSEKLYLKKLHKLSSLNKYANEICFNETMKMRLEYQNIDFMIFQQRNRKETFQNCSSNQVGLNTAKSCQELNDFQFSSSDSVLVYNCSNFLLNCALDCVPPSTQLITGLSTSFSCLFQKKIHVSIQNSIFAFIVFILINIGRIFLLDGLVRICYYSLAVTSDIVHEIVITYHKKIDTSPEMQKVEDVVAIIEKEKVRLLIQRFNQLEGAIGWLFIYFSVCCQFLWILFGLLSFY